MEYQLMRGDSVFVLCDSCKQISFDHKVCRNCDSQIPKTNTVKISTRNGEIIVADGTWNIKPMVPVMQSPEWLELFGDLDIKEKEAELKSSEEQRKKSKPKKKDDFYYLLKTVKDYDLDTLDGRNDINDTVIDVYLRYIYGEISPELQARTYIFSTLFFDGLRKKWIEAEKKEEIDVESKKRWVKTNMWTRKVDLFSRDFIFIPINENKHWYLIVLCYLPKFVAGHTSSETDADTPCFYFFDSLDNAPIFSDEKLTNAKYITEFLEMQWNIGNPGPSNPGAKCDWSKIIFLYKVNCPQQENTYDCGIYLLEYVERFFKISISRSLDLSRWFSREDVQHKRKEIKNIIKKLIAKELGTYECSSDSDE